jgi:hypothetical protein
LNELHSWSAEDIYLLGLRRLCFRVPFSLRILIAAGSSLRIAMVGLMASMGS